MVEVHRGVVTVTLSSSIKIGEPCELDPVVDGYSMFALAMIGEWGDEAMLWLGESPIAVEPRTEPEDRPGQVDEDWSILLQEEFRTGTLGRCVAG